MRSCSWLNPESPSSRGSGTQVCSFAFSSKYRLGSSFTCTSQPRLKPPHQPPYKSHVAFVEDTFAGAGRVQSNRLCWMSRTPCRIQLLCLRAESYQSSQYEARRIKKVLEASGWSQGRSSSTSPACHSLRPLGEAVVRTLRLVPLIWNAIVSSNISEIKDTR